MKKQWLKPTLQLSAALLIVIVLLAVYTVPRPLTELLFPGKEGWEMEGVLLTVIVPEDASKPRDKNSMREEYDVSFYEAEKLLPFAELLRSAKVVYRTTLTSLRISPACYYRVSPDINMSHLPPHTNSFRIMEEDNAIYISRAMSDKYDKYKMNPRDYDRLIAILRTLAAEGTPVEPPSIIIEPEAKWKNALF